MLPPPSSPLGLLLAFTLAACGGAPRPVPPAAPSAPAAFAPRPAGEAAGPEPQDHDATGPREQFVLGRAGSPAADPEDTVVNDVPLGASPVRGKATALVTVVEFSDYQCPFCGRVEPTLARLATLYGERVRFVYKDAPLAFHARAEPAAELALEALAQKGEAAFWKVHDALLADQRALDDASLASLANAVGLNAPAAMTAVAAHRHQALIEADLDLAEDLQASGTPTFFVNGRRLVGAVPVEAFQALIDEELRKAEALVKAGAAPEKVYAQILATAAPAPAVPRVVLPAPTAASPSRGPADAKVTVQYFGDFQCPFCGRAEQTLAELEKAFPGKLRIVWRNLPLSMHGNARHAAAAALEAFAQQGSAGFWAMHGKLFEPRAQGLDRPILEQLAKEQHLDLARFAKALDAGTHEARIATDERLASAASITGTPAFVINGYLVSGAQPLSRFTKVVKRALAEAK